MNVPGHMVMGANFQKHGQERSDILRMQWHPFVQTANQILHKKKRSRIVLVWFLY